MDRKPCLAGSTQCMRDIEPRDCCRVFSPEKDRAGSESPCSVKLWRCGCCGERREASWEVDWIDVPPMHRLTCQRQMHTAQ